MTEQEWLECARPGPMFDALDGKMSTRKFKLCAVACCRSIWRLLPDQRSRYAVDVAELAADGMASAEDLARAAAAANQARLEARSASCNPTMEAAIAAEATISSFSRQIPHSAWHASKAYFDAWLASPSTRQAGTTGLEEDANQARIIRDIFGNHFHPVTFEPTWRTATVTSLAQATYTNRTFEQLPILADALEEAGCTDAAILNHCRQPGEHVRGCWAIDVVLGRK